MAERKTVGETEGAVAAMEPPIVEAVTRTQPPTLDEAFTVLCNVLAALYEDDNMPLYLRCKELAIIKENGNVVYAWTNIIFVLEQALGTSLRVP